MSTDRVLLLKQISENESEYKKAKNSWENEKRVKAKNVLMTIALQASEDVAGEAREALQRVIIAKQDHQIMLDLAKGLTDIKEGKLENLKSAVYWYALGYKNANESWNDAARNKAMQGLMLLALQASEDVAKEARDTLKRIIIAKQDHRIMFDLAQGLAKSKEAENLKSAVYWYALNYKNADESWNDAARNKAMQGLMLLALQASEDVAKEARDALKRIIIAKQDHRIMFDLAQSLAKSKEKENLKSAVYWYALSYKNADESWNDAARNQATQGLMLLALQASEDVAKEARDALKKIIIAKQDHRIMFDLAQGLAKSKEKENLKSAVYWYALSYKNADESWNDAARNKATQGLMLLALQASEDVAKEARDALKKIIIAKQDRRIMFDLAQSLAKSKEKENLKSAVYWYALSYKNADESWNDGARNQAMQGLMLLALQTSEDVAKEARNVLKEVIIVKQDHRIMFDLAKSLAESKEKENLKSAVYWYELSYKNADESWNDGARNQAKKGLMDIASRALRNIDESSLEVMNAAIIALGNCYKSYSKESYPNFKEVLTFFDKVDDLYSKLASDPEKQKILMDKREELLKVIVENNLTNFLQCLTEQIEVPEMKGKIAEILPKLEELYKGNKGNNIDAMARLYEKLGQKTKAFEMYQRAEKSGSVPAASRLASVYERGELGQAINIEAAVALYLKVSNAWFKAERDFTQEKARPTVINIFRKAAIISANKVIELAPQRIPEIHIPIPNQIKGADILRFIASASFVDAKDVLGEKLISSHPSFLALVDKWCDKYENIEEFAKLEERTGGRIRHRILEGVYAGKNELALHIKERLVSRWERNKNPKAQKLLEEFYAAEFQFADAVGHADREKLRSKAQISEEKLAVVSSVHELKSKVQVPEKKQPTATYTSATAAPSFRDKMFNFFDRKGTQLVKGVKAKQQAMNDSDPEDLGHVPSSQRKGSKQKR